MKLYRKKSDLFALFLVGLTVILVLLELLNLHQYKIVVGFTFFALFFIYVFIILMREPKQTKNNNKSSLNK